MSITVTGLTQASIAEQAGLPLADGLLHLQLVDLSGTRGVACEFYAGGALTEPSLAYGTLSNDLSEPRLDGAWPLDEQRFAALLRGESYDAQLDRQQGAAVLLLGRLVGDTVEDLGAEIYTGGSSQADLDQGQDFREPTNPDGLSPPSAMLRRANGSANYLGRDGRLWALTATAAGPRRGALLAPARHPGAVGRPLAPPWLPVDYYEVDGAGIDVATGVSVDSPGFTALAPGLSATFDGGNAQLDVYRPALTSVPVTGGADSLLLASSDPTDGALLQDGFLATGVQPTLHETGDLLLFAARRRDGGTVYLIAGFQVLADAVVQRSAWLRYAQVLDPAQAT